MLDEDARRRLYTNPLRILDTKNPQMQELVNTAPRLLDFLGEESRAFLARMEQLVSAAGIDYVIQHDLSAVLTTTTIRSSNGSPTSSAPRARSAAADATIRSSKCWAVVPAPGVGFAMGMERVIELMRECGRVPTRTQTDVYVLHSGEDTQVQAMLLAEALRDVGPCA